MNSHNLNLAQVAAFFIRITLGIVFIVAAYPKIEDPAAFAAIIYGYGIFPAEVINLAAIVVPYVERVAGFGLIVRFYPRSSLFIINSLLGLFILIIGFNLARGHSFDCGCFSVGGQGPVESAVFLLARDMAMLAAGMYAWKKTVWQ
mgnify:FL=1